MVECGIPRYKAKRTPKITQFHFLHFIEVRHRIDSVPRKRLYRLDVFRDLSKRALMNRFESQMAYGIIKRSFRAFYYGTGEGGIPNAKVLARKTHNEQCIWVHAARRLAQLYNSYVGVLPIYQKYIELSLKRYFQRLHDSLAIMKVSKHKKGECICLKCSHRVMENSTTAKNGGDNSNSDNESNAKNENKFQLTVSEILEQRAAEYNRPQCNCQTFKWSKLDHIIHKQAVQTNTGYGQGPFRCTWFIARKEEIEEDHKPLEANLPEEYPCPVDSSVSDLEDFEEECSSCECNCEYCECENESDLDEIDEMEQEESVFEDVEGFEEVPNDSSFTFFTKCGLATTTSNTSIKKTTPCQNKIQKKAKAIRVKTQ